MGLGRTTRFAPLPARARRISVMRSGSGGVKALAPSDALLRAFQDAKTALVRGGMEREPAHAEACRSVDYRTRFRQQMRGSPASMAALRQVIAQAREADVYLMCMCQYRTPEEACHTYLLLALARELDPSLVLLPEPAPRRPPRPGS